MFINGKEHRIPELTYNAICDLDERYGVDVFKIDEASALRLVRGFLALSMRSKEASGNELEKHFMAGGTLEDAVTEIGGALERSGFLSSMRKQAQEKSEKETKEKKAAESLPKPTTE